MLDIFFLTAFPLLPLATALLLALVKPSPSTARGISIASSILLVVASVLLLLELLASTHGGFLLRERLEFLPPRWGISWHLGVDGISAPLLALTAIVQWIATLASRPAEKSTGYFVLFQLLFAGVYGSFLALDAFVFYVFWELMLIPLFLLIAIWGGEDRRRAATKFFLYTMGGSLLLLLGILLLNLSIPSEGKAVLVRSAEAIENVRIDAQGHASLYDLPLLRPDSSGQLQSVAASHLLDAPLLVVVVPRNFDLLHWKLLANHWSQVTLFGVRLSALVFFLFLIGFAVKIPAVPLHAWLPHAHVQAPTAISVVLAGILLKLGVYGLVRLAWPLFPGEVTLFGPLVAWLGLAAIVWGGFCALGQSDLKRLVAYSSISHMGFCLVGLAAANDAGLSGALFQCVAHGISASLLFLLVGSLYERAHHRRIDGFGGMRQLLPVLSVSLIFAAMAGAGLPGLAGFVGEFSVLIGAWQSAAIRLPALLSAIGAVLAAAYLLWMLQRVVFGPSVNSPAQAWKDLDGTERLSVFTLIALALLLGLFPQILQSVLGPATHSLAQHIAWANGLRQ